MHTVSLKDCLNTLPVGLLRQSSKGVERIRAFELGPITGRVRLAMGKDAVRQNPGKQTTELLLSTLRALGEISPTREVIRELTFIDREFMGWIHMLRRLKSSTIELSEACNSCGTMFETSVSTDDLQVNVLDDEDFVAHKGNYYTFKFEGPHGPLVLRMLNGFDEEANAAFRVNNPEEAGLKDIHAALVSLDGKEYTFDEFLDLPENTIEWIQAAAGSLDIGSSQRIITVCPHCNEDTEMVVSPLALLGDWSPPKVSPPYETRSSS